MNTKSLYTGNILLDHKECKPYSAQIVCSKSFQYMFTWDFFIKFNLAISRQLNRYRFLITQVLYIFLRIHSAYNICTTIFDIYFQCPILVCQIHPVIE